MIELDLTLPRSPQVAGEDLDRQEEQVRPQHSRPAAVEPFFKF